VTYALALETTEKSENVADAVTNACARHRRQDEEEKKKRERIGVKAGDTERGGGEKERMGDSSDRR
jgi:hypothetical protein